MLHIFMGHIISPLIHSPPLNSINRLEGALALQAEANATPS